MRIDCQNSKMTEPAVTDSERNIFAWLLVVVMKVTETEIDFIIQVVIDRSHSLIVSGVSLLINEAI